MGKRRIRVVCAALEREGTYLITQRTDRAVLPGLWEFPGGKVEEGERDTEALSRELAYRLGVTAKVHELISDTEREYDKYIVELHLYRCEITEGEPAAKTVADLAWVRSDQFSDYEFTPADEASMNALLGEL